MIELLALVLIPLAVAYAIGSWRFERLVNSWEESQQRMERNAARLRQATEPAALYYQVVTKPSPEVQIQKLQHEYGVSSSGKGTWGPEMARLMRESRQVVREAA